MTVTAIDHRNREYSISHAYGLAQAAQLAYQDEATIDQQAREWGFDRVRHHHTAFRPPFPLEDTQAYTMASDDMIVTAFRGTEPAQLRDWLSDVNTPPWPGPGGTGFMHYGFGEALKSVFPDVLEAVQEFRTNGQSLWFTGHSLGGALAMLAAARLYLEEPRLLADGVYTFGQPRTCDRLLAGAYNKAFTERTYRFVNNNDIVPQMPPEPVYTHVDAVRYIDSSGRVRDRMTVTGGLMDRVKGVTADPFAPASDGVRDHFMKNYLAALRDNLP
ncbi:lipase family protein [Streptomyces alkaliterrae]|uniref:Lipase family protein n=1 Tax=Streptomyces alkaliterrae TaxID=2213162 RepID=A0A5P0YT00_9ACTN|nr:lipase family protein [Streptomyces alkaliterrae]MBB1255445.1 lipase family protein [Streptomyces alkaliterrae]MBB1259969.1 lipase family protein [Streptomyces alkaliterrae]MQS03408.1 lipase family protein [Streptomyces alkaliterrae]